MVRKLLMWTGLKGGATEKPQRPGNEVTGLQLHHWYSVEEATAACGGGAARTYCDGQFAVLPKVVLCMIAVGAEESASRAETPSSIVWVSQCRNHRLPKKVANVWSTFRRRRMRHHHVFLRPVDGDRCRHFYAGEAECWPRSKHEARFWLSHPLPHGVWLQLGGYPGWLVYADCERHRVAPGDRATFERLAARPTAAEYSYLYMTRYEQDSLTVDTNANRGRLMYEGSDHRILWALDTTYQGDPDAIEVFAEKGGHCLASHTLPRNQAMRAAVEFFVTGELPNWISWVE